MQFGWKKHCSSTLGWAALCPECLGTNAPLQSPRNQYKGAIDATVKRRGKKKVVWYLRRKNIPRETCETNSSVSHQYSWNLSAAGGWQHKGIWQDLCLFQRVCSVCVSPTWLSPCAVSTCICSCRCAQLHLITYALSQLQALASNDLRCPSQGVLKLLLFSRQHLTFAENCPLLKCLSLDSPNKHK